MLCRRIRRNTKPTTSLRQKKFSLQYKPMACPISLGCRHRSSIRPLMIFIPARWGDPISLLMYPHLTLTEKFRTSLQMFLTTKSGNFDRIEHLTSRQWIERGSGKSVYNKLRKRLQELKFYELADEVSAS